MLILSQQITAINGFRIGDKVRQYCNLQDKFLYSSQYPVTDAYELFDWLLTHHFDFRHLIEKGLALEALEGMYKTE